MDYAISVSAEIACVFWVIVLFDDLTSVSANAQDK